MANTIDFNVNTNAVTVLNQTGAAAENTAKGFTSAKAELRALQNQMLEMDQTSEEFKKASTRAAQLKDTISDLSAEINANAGNAFEGLSNNVGLFGSRLMSLDLKGAGQALSGMGNAVSRIDFKTLKDEVGGLIQGFGNLAKALLSNPILLLAGVVAGAIIYFDELKTIFEDLTMSADKMSRRLSESKQVLEEVGKSKVVTENIKLLSKVVNDHTKSEEDRKKALDKLNVAFKANNIQTVDNINNTDVLSKSTENLTTKLVKEAEVRGKMAYLQELYAKKTKIAAERTQGITSGLLLNLELTARTSNNLQAKFAAGVVDIFSSSTLSDIENISNQIKLVEDNILSSSEAISQIDISGAIPPAPPEPPKPKDKIDVNEQNAIRAAKELKLEKELADLKLKVREDYIKANQSAQANELYELEKKKELELQTYEGDEEDKIYIIEKYRLAEIDINTKYDDLALEEQNAFNEKKKAADQKAKEDELAREKQLAADKLAAEQALMDAKFNLASASVNLLGTLFAKNKKAADIAFALDKALAIAQVVVNTQREISSYNSNPFWSASIDGGASIKIPAIIGAKLRAAASIAAIAGTAIGRFAGGGGGNNNAGSNGGGGGTTAPSPANFDFISQQPNQQPPLQAYIVGSQVSSNLEAQQLIQNQSRLGG
jgi:hypothetical protein